MYCGHNSSAWEQNFQLGEVQNICFVIGIMYCGHSNSALEQKV